MWVDHAGLAKAQTQQATVDKCILVLGSGHQKDLAQGSRKPFAVVEQGTLQEVESNHGGLAPSSSYLNVPPLPVIMFGQWHAAHVLVPGHGFKDTA